MNPNETSVNGTRPVFYNGEQVEQPGTSSSNPMESLAPLFLTIPDDQELMDILFKTDSTENSTLCNEQCPCGQCLIFQSLPGCFLNVDSTPCCNDIFPSPAVTEHDHRSPPSAVSPVSTYTGPIMPSASEDAAEALSAMEGAQSAIVNNSRNFFNVSNPENSVLPAALSKPGCSRTCTGCHDAHRLTASEVEIRRKKFFKGVNKKKNSDKWTCEIRISKKLRLENSEQEVKPKQWLGTFDTRCQAARALQVGRYLLSEKKKNPTADANFEQNPQTIRVLSEFKDFMRGKPLDEELLLRVKKLAVDYGKNGSL